MINLESYLHSNGQTNTGKVILDLLPLYNDLRARTSALSRPLFCLVTAFRFHLVWAEKNGLPSMTLQISDFVVSFSLFKVKG